MSPVASTRSIRGCSTSTWSTTALSEARVSIPNRRCCASANRWLSVSCTTQTEPGKPWASDVILPLPKNFPPGWQRRPGQSRNWLPPPNRKCPCGPARCIRSPPQGQRPVAQAVALAIAQPSTEKAVELVFLVRLQHLLVGIGVDAAEAPAVVGGDHLGHAHVVVQAHFHARRLQPVPAALVPQLQGRGIGAAFQHTDDQLLFRPVDAQGNLPFALLGHARHQLVQADEVGFAYCLQCHQIHTIAGFACDHHGRGPACSRTCWPLSSNHCRAMMLAALSRRPSLSACRASARLSTCTRISSPSSARPWMPPTPRLSTRAQNRCTCSLLPPGDGK